MTPGKLYRFIMALLTCGLFSKMFTTKSVISHMYVWYIVSRMFDGVMTNNIMNKHIQIYNKVKAIQLWSLWNVASSDPS